MTKAKSSQARSIKRNARAKAKKLSNNKARTSPKVKSQKAFDRLWTGNRLEFDQVLASATKAINNREQTANEFSSIQDVLEGLKKNVGEVFKLYSYITLLNVLDKEGVIDFKLVIDLKALSIDLINIDKRIQVMSKLVEADEEEAILTEALDISTSLQNYSEEMYTEVVRSEEHALTIEESLSRLANEIKDIEDDNQCRLEVLSRIAYQYLGEVKAELDAQANKEAETAEAVAE